MTKSGIPRLPLDEAKAAADEAGVPDYMAELASSRCCCTIRCWRGPSTICSPSMLWHGALDSRLRELVIMRIGWLTACDYEWTQHWRVASGLGVPAKTCSACAIGVRTRVSGPPNGRSWRPPTTWCATAR